LSATVVPLPTGPQPDEWADIEVRVPPPLPRIEPGRYQAFSARLVKFDAFGRTNLRLDFDVFQGPLEDGVVLGRVPMFLRLPGRKGLSPTSKLARLLYVAGVQTNRWQKFSLAALRAKAWIVDVGDAEHDSSDGDLAPGVIYSVVKRVVEKLT